MPESSNPVSPPPMPAAASASARTVASAGPAPTNRNDRARSGRRPARKASPLARIGMILFALGLVAVVVIMVLFASGSQDLPLWLNLSAMLAPVGLGVGLVGVFLEARSKEKR